MKRYFYILFLIPSLLFCAYPLFADSIADSTVWTEDTDGDLKENEYRVVDPKGAVTRRPCPYTCEMRNIPKEHCKEWKSITHSVDGECYVQDLRKGRDDAMPKDTHGEAAKTTSRYK